MIFDLTKEEREYCLGLYKALKSGISGNNEFPLIVELQTQNRCNAKCPMCPYASTTAKEDLTKMSNELFLKIVTELSREQDFSSLVLSFQNEPLLDLNLIEKAKIFKQMMPSKNLQIVTNGSLLGKKIVKDIYEYFDLVSISVNATTPETYKKVMGTLDYNILNTNLELISTNKKWVDKTILRFINQQSNYQERKDFKKYWNKKGFRVFSFDMNSRLNSVENYANLKPKNSASKKINQTTLKVISKFFLPHCPIPSVSFYVRANGDVVLCFNDWKNNNILGNVKDNSVRDIFNSERYKLIRKNAITNYLPDGEICKDCDLVKDGIWLTV